MTYDPRYWRTIWKNRGTLPRRIDRAKFWELLEVMYPARWEYYGDEFECFAMSETQTGDLHTWCVRIGTEKPEYWQMIAPISATTDYLHSRVLLAMEAERKMV